MPSDGGDVVPRRRSRSWTRYTSPTPTAQKPLARVVAMLAKVTDAVPSVKSATLRGTFTGRPAKRVRCSSFPHAPDAHQRSRIPEGAFLARLHQHGSAVVAVSSRARSARARLRVD